MNFKKEYVPKLPIKILNCQFMSPNLESHAALRYMTFLLRFQSEQDVKKAKKLFIEEVIYQDNNRYYGFIDTKNQSYFPPECSQKAHYDLILIQEGMVPEPYLIFIDNIQPWNVAKIDNVAQYMRKYYEKQIGVSIEIYSTKKQTYRYQIGQIFFSVATEDLLDQLTQDLVTKGLQLTRSWSEPLVQNPEYQVSFGKQQNFVPLSHINRIENSENKYKKQRHGSRGSQDARRHNSNHNHRHHHHHHHHHNRHY